MPETYARVGLGRRNVSGMYGLPDDINQYADQHTTALPEFMRRLADDTRASQDLPQMLTGPAAARLLELLVWISGAKRVLEIGTYTGHSALALAGAMGSDGRVITCELDAGRAAFARAQTDGSPFGNRIEILVGPALESIADLSGAFDLVFIDADKAGYPAYVEATLPLLSDRGVLVLDNTLQSGGVLDEGATGQVKVMQDLNDRLATDPGLITVLLTVRDGMTVVRKA